MADNKLRDSRCALVKSPSSGPHGVRWDLVLYDCSALVRELQSCMAFNHLAFSLVAGRPMTSVLDAAPVLTGKKLQGFTEGNLLASLRRELPNGRTRP